MMSIMGCMIFMLFLSNSFVLRKCLSSVNVFVISLNGMMVCLLSRNTVRLLMLLVRFVILMLLEVVVSGIFVSCVYVSSSSVFVFGL